MTSQGFSKKLECAPCYPQNISKQLVKGYGHWIPWNEIRPPAKMDQWKANILLMEENPTPTWDVKNPVYHRISTISTGDRWISEPSTVFHHTKSLAFNRNLPLNTTPATGHLTIDSPENHPMASSILRPLMSQPVHWRAVRWWYNPTRGSISVRGESGEICLVFIHLRIQFGFKTVRISYQDEL